MLILHAITENSGRQLHESPPLSAELLRSLNASVVRRGCVEIYADFSEASLLIVALGVVGGADPAGT